MDSANYMTTFTMHTPWSITHLHKPPPNLQNHFCSSPNKWASNTQVAWYPARRKSAWCTPMRFRLIKNGVAHVYDVYTI